MTDFRNAVRTDMDFITEAITEADKSGTDVFSYARIFGISNQQAETLIKSAILEDIPGQEFCLSCYIIAEINSETAGTCCSWIESREGVPSGLIKAGLLHHFLGNDIIANAQEKSALINDTLIAREAGTLQIESVYVSNKFRGLGVSKELIIEHIRRHLSDGEKFEKVQIQLSGNNSPAINSYQKLGFITRMTKTSLHQEITKYLPSDTKIMMELSVSSLIGKGLINL